MPSRWNWFARLLPCLAMLFAVSLFVSPRSCAQLSPNSGINGSDTWVTFDLLLSTSGTVSMPSPFYDPSTATTTSTLNIAPPIAFVPCRSRVRCKWRAGDEPAADGHAD